LIHRIQSKEFRQEQETYSQRNKENEKWFSDWHFMNRFEYPHNGSLVSRIGLLVAAFFFLLLFQEVFRRRTFCRRRLVHYFQVLAISRFLLLQVIAAVDVTQRLQHIDRFVVSGLRLRCISVFHLFVGFIHLSACRNRRSFHTHIAIVIFIHHLAILNY